MSPPLAPDDPRHGTPNGALNYGCECEPCLDARRVYQRGRYHATKDSRSSTRREIPGPGVWDRRAACAPRDDLPWTRDHPTDAQVAAMKAVCRRCPVLTDCTAYVAKHGGAGIIAGTTPTERKRQEWAA